MPAKNRTPARKAKKPHDHEYRVVWNQRRRSWEIERDGARSAQFANDKTTAIGLAVSDARLEAAQGLNVIVWVEQTDGSYQLEWTS